MMKKKMITNWESHTRAISCVERHRYIAVCDLGPVSCFAASYEAYATHVRFDPCRL